MNTLRIEVPGKMLPTMLNKRTGSKKKEKKNHKNPLFLNQNFPDFHIYNICTDCCDLAID